MLKITYFVHGTTTDNELDLATGWAPGELSELGIQQSKDLGKLAEDRGFSVVFCSDLKRAVDSANFAFAAKYEIIPDKRLREANYGDFTQKPSFQFKDDMVKYVQTPFPGGESYKDVEKRVADFLKETSQKYDGKHIAIVAHQAPQLALDVLLRGKTWEQAIHGRKLNPFIFNACSPKFGFRVVLALRAILAQHSNRTSHIPERYTKLC